MTTRYCVFPHKGEYAVAHLGLVQHSCEKGFSTGWVVDQLCPTIQSAADAMKALVKADRARQAGMYADLRSLNRHKR